MRTSIEVIPFYRERRHKRTMEQESLAGQTELKRLTSITVKSLILAQDER
jgi:hypothetical protein